MRVLIACEFSGRVRNAFRARGHEAYSVDLLAADDGVGIDQHFMGDVLPVAYQTGYWDLMIAHPPCTFLCNSGVRWIYGGKGQTIDPVRFRAMEDAARFFNTLLEAPIPRIAVENPIQHRFARRHIRQYDQIIHPWQFGVGETKATAMWLKGLPLLTPTEIVDGRTPAVHYASPSKDRGKRRSVTPQGFATAFAEQWGDL